MISHHNKTTNNNHADCPSAAAIKFSQQQQQQQQSSLPLACQRTSPLLNLSTCLTASNIPSSNSRSSIRNITTPSPIADCVHDDHHHNNNIMMDDDDNEQFLELPAKKARKDPFPPGCRVLSCLCHSNNNDNDNDHNVVPAVTCYYGTVQQVGINVDSDERENLYKIKVLPANDDDGALIVIVKGPDLQFAPFSPVWVHLDEMDSGVSDGGGNDKMAAAKQQQQQRQPGWILSSEHAVSHDSHCGRVMYTVQTMMEPTPKAAAAAKAVVVEVIKVPAEQLAARLIGDSNPAVVPRCNTTTQQQLQVQDVVVGADSSAMHVENNSVDQQRHSVLPRTQDHQQPQSGTITPGDNTTTNHSPSPLQRRQQQEKQQQAQAASSSSSRSLLLLPSPVHDDDDTDCNQNQVPLLTSAATTASIMTTPTTPPPPTTTPPPPSMMMSSYEPASSANAGPAITIMASSTNACEASTPPTPMTGNNNDDNNSNNKTDNVHHDGDDIATPAFMMTPPPPPTTTTTPSTMMSYYGPVSANNNNNDKNDHPPHHHHRCDYDHHNPHPNPFARIERSKYHCFPKAITRIQRHLARSGGDLSKEGGVGAHIFRRCLTWHLRGECRRNCLRSLDHRELTPDEARRLEEALEPAISPHGPIREKQPLQPQRRGRNPLPTTVSGTRKRLSWASLPEPMGGDGGAGDGDVLSPAMKKQQLTMYPHPTTPQRGLQQQQQQQQQHPFETVSSEYSTPFQRMHLPIQFGVDFFKTIIIGDRGNAGKHLAETFNCKLHLRGTSVPGAYPRHKGCEPLFLDIVRRNNASGVKECCQQVQQMLYNSCHYLLRGSLMFFLATLNTHVYTMRLNIVHAPSNPHKNEWSYMAHIKLGLKSNPEQWVIGVDEAWKHVRSIQKHHPNCRVEVRESCEAHPIVLPHVFMSGPTFDDVYACREEFNQIGGLSSNYAASGPS